jgi:hypothetical protein
VHRGTSLGIPAAEIARRFLARSGFAPISKRAVLSRFRRTHVLKRSLYRDVSRAMTMPISRRAREPARASPRYCSTRRRIRAIKRMIFRPQRFPTLPPRRDAHGDDKDERCSRGSSLLLLLLRGESVSARLDFSGCSLASPSFSFSL